MFATQNKAGERTTYTLNINIHNHKTRMCKNIHVPSIKSNNIKEDLFRAETITHNKLPTTVKDCVSIKPFKRKLKQHPRDAGVD